MTKWIAYHGCSININNNLQDYKKIIPCGLMSSQITSVEKENPFLLDDINKNLKQIFILNFKKL